MGCVTTTEQPSRAPRRDATENRAALLDAAKTCLQHDPDASIETIAASAGLSRRAVYGHFPSRDDLVREARRLGVPVVVDTGERSSDHWSFVRAGLPGVRLCSTPYAGYHSPQDVPSVVDPAQLERTARLLVAWLAP